MAESVYKVIELIGTSKDSWEKAAAAAVNRAGKSLRDLRVAEVVKLDLQLDAKGKVEAYRAKVNVSFKFEGSAHCKRRSHPTQGACPDHSAPTPFSLSPSLDRDGGMTLPHRTSDLRSQPRQRGRRRR